MAAARSLLLLLLLVVATRAPASKPRHRSRELQSSGGPPSCAGPGDTSCSAGLSCVTTSSGSRRRASVQGRRLFGAPSASSSSSSPSYYCLAPQCDAAANTAFLSTLSPDMSGTNCQTYVAMAISGGSSDMNVVCQCFQTTTGTAPDCRPSATADFTFAYFLTNCAAMASSSG